MPNNQELYKITHSSPEFNTVGDFLNDEDSPAFIYNSDPTGFLNIVGEDKKTNRQRIEASYNNPEEKRFIGASAATLLLKVGTILYLEYSKVNTQSFLTEGISVVSTDEVAFKAARLAEIEADPGYFQINKPTSGEHLGGISQEQMPEITVWCWCRSLSNKTDEDLELRGQFFDLTPFIQKCTTNIGKNGGNFSITLPPLECVLDSDRKWVLKKSTIDRYENNNGASIQGEGYVAQSSLFTEEDGELVRNQMLFHNIISSNDLVLIRFETLDLEAKQRYSDANEFYINKSQIAGRIYDMIGLVDSNNLTVSPANNDVSINISGRDLSKLFIEDGTYFYPLAISGGELKFAGSERVKSSLISRNFVDGGMRFIGLYNQTSIESILKFIIQQLANIEIVPNDLFSSYGDRVNKRFNEIDFNANKTTDNSAVIPNSNYTPKYKQEKASGIWQLVKLVVDSSVSARRIADSSFSTAQGSLLNFIHTAVQEPLCEVIMDSYFDMYHIVVRKPPTDQKALISLIEGKVNTETGIPSTPPAIIDIEQKDVLQESLSFDDTQVYSWYNFFPRGAMINSKVNYASTYPAIFFEEYAKVWGSKPFQQSHAYIPYFNKQGNDNVMSIMDRQAFLDLKYVIESNQYLPFTRKGSIVLNGDRRIKIGNVIRYKSTGEIFMVDQVQQTYQINEQSIDRTTTINVSRGMIEQLIYGIQMPEKDGSSQRLVSYYNIINTELNFSEREIIKKVTKRRVKKKPVSNTNSFLSPEPAPVAINQTISFDGFNGTLLEQGNTGVFLLEKYNTHPENKRLFVKFINSVNDSGYYVTITSTGRSYAQQAALKKINVNNAAPGTSRHESGSAIDINLKNKKTGETHLKNSPAAAWKLTGVPALAKAIGLQWAGGDGSFGSYVDRGHFQISNSSEDTTTQDEYEEYEEDVKTNEINKDQIFSNYRVNKFTFNFFLKNLQFDPAFKNVTSRNVYNSDEQGSLVEVKVTSTTKSRKK